MVTTPFIHFFVFLIPGLMFCSKNPALQTIVYLLLKFTMAKHSRCFEPTIQTASLPRSTDLWCYKMHQVWKTSKQTMAHMYTHVLSHVFFSSTVGLAYKKTTEWLFLIPTHKAIIKRSAAFKISINLDATKNKRKINQIIWFCSLFRRPIGW